MNVRARDAIDGGRGLEDDPPHPATTPPPITSTQAQTTERSIGSLYASLVIVVTQHCLGQCSGMTPEVPGGGLGCFPQPAGIAEPSKASGKRCWRCSSRVYRSE